jgi:hypothetical protein
MQKHALEEGIRELDQLKDVSNSTSGEEQLTSIEFLK